VLRLRALEGRASPRAASAAPAAQTAAPIYARHISERTLLYPLVQAQYPDSITRLAAQDRPLPGYVREEFDAFLRCGVLDHAFLRVGCEQREADRLLTFSCKKRGFCPSCGARRMAESARHLAEKVFGPRPVRQWVLSFPCPLRFLLASRPEAIGPVLGIVHRVIAGWLADQTGVDRATVKCGAVPLIQRFGSALNLNIYFHMLMLDGVSRLTRSRRVGRGQSCRSSGDQCRFTRQHPSRRAPPPAMRALPRAGRPAAPTGPSRRMTRHSV